MQLRKIVMGSVAAAAALVAQAPAHAWTQNAHYWMSVGVFSRFNVVTRDDFKAKNSDMQCGFAAGGNAYLKGGYSIGKADIVHSNAQGRPQLGMLVSGKLDWSDSPSGSIDGAVILGQGSNVTLAPDARVTLKPGSAVFPATGNDLFQAIAPELWAGWGDDTVSWGHNSVEPLNKTPGAVGWTGHREVPLGSAVGLFFDSYLGNMHGGIWVTPANGQTTVRSDTPGRTNIALDGKNFGRCDMPGNNAGNCSATGGANGQPGGRRAVYLFDVNADDLSKADVVNLSNTRWTDEFGSRTWNVIKVKANGQTSVKLQNMGLQDFAANNDHTIWVFDNAITKIELGGVAIEGTILAPKAAVVADNGHINGTIIAKSFEGTMEGHCKPFVNYIDP